MDIDDFLLARLDEGLTLAGCIREVDADGRLVCRCQHPTEEISEAVTRANLVLHTALRRPRYRDPLLQMLADQYAAHPEYDPAWHPIGRTSRV